MKNRPYRTKWLDPSLEVVVSRYFVRLSKIIICGIRIATHDANEDHADTLMEEL